jgi:ABC-type nickel/cobalt efflux system permease component RcnA
MRNLWQTARRLAQEEFSPDEIREILKRAAELQQEMETTEPRISRDALAAGARAAGISETALERAITEFLAKRQPKQRRSWGKWLGGAIAALFALPILIFVLGVVSFTFGITLTVLASVGLALLAAGLALLLAMPFAGFGILIGVLAGLMKLFKGK